MTPRRYLLLLLAALTAMVPLGTGLSAAESSDPHAPPDPAHLDPSLSIPVPDPAAPDAAAPADAPDVAPTPDPAADRETDPDVPDPERHERAPEHDDGFPEHDDPDDGMEDQPDTEPDVEPVEDRDEDEDEDEDEDRDEDEDEDDVYDNMELLTQVLLHIRKHYVVEKGFKDITYGALHGMLQALDPHSDFLEPRAFQAVREDTIGAFGGIGIHIGIRNGLLTVIAPIEDTPAFRAGILPGDVIVEVDGTSTLGLSLREAVDHLRGPKGSSVRVTIQRGGEEGTHDLKIVRDDIEVASVKGAAMLRDGIGYVRITQFSRPTAGMLREAIERLDAEGLDALVVDLRNNPGGLLSAAIEVTSLFVPEDAVVVSTRGRAGPDDETVAIAGKGRHFASIPMAVLVNRGSASASEIMAGCLQDHGRAVIIGERTFGKGSVQSVIRLRQETEAGAAIRLTTAYYYTPGGRLIHDEGIEPDIVEPVTPQEWRRVQVQRARQEAPDLFRDEPADDETAVDRPLRRALDMLEAVRIFRDRGTPDPEA